MLEFSHRIGDPEGLHARPVAQIAAEARKWSSDIIIGCAGRSVSARDLMALMALGAHQGDTLDVIVEGEDERAAAEGIRRALSL
ncbi:Phosphotransferase system, phosphocarrier protein HPr [Coriobacterium glomerans PW2]|uniref:Phosphotransferase system, phosphocarrier protein HPr n=1 Tax=Coriobacterium glomerans (strain ATCC 49209 / DSM 20642 / JCM 10262 / PW2) TaxID=700015 RepID=F2NAT3_CORGP|nr:HPr family phosphocarrier protein [Coriobacterium glomerans]AEB07539.1 Phosphotransferase system, phosphocarrier protein HPr [Coriobacterium glomerans PW2]